MREREKEVVDNIYTTQDGKLLLDIGRVNKGGGGGGIYHRSSSLGNLARVLMPSRLYISLFSLCVAFSLSLEARAAPPCRRDVGFLPLIPRDPSPDARILLHGEK